MTKGAQISFEKINGFLVERVNNENEQDQLILDTASTKRLRPF